MRKCYREIYFIENNSGYFFGPRTNQTGMGLLFSFPTAPDLASRIHLGRKSRVRAIFRFIPNPAHWQPHISIYYPYKREEMTCLIFSLHYYGAHLIYLITYKFCGWPERISALDEKGGAFMKTHKKKKGPCQLCANKQFLGLIIVIIFQKDEGRLLSCLLFSCFLMWAFDKAPILQVYTFVPSPFPITFHLALSPLLG